MCRSLLMIAIALSVSHLSHAQDVHVQVSKEFKFSATDAYHFPTIMNALDHAPDVAPGTYAERVYVSQYRPRTTLVGMGKDPSEVVITAAQNPKSSQSTFFSETMEVLAEDCGCIAEDEVDGAADIGVDVVLASVLREERVLIAKDAAVFEDGPIGGHAHVQDDVARVLPGVRQHWRRSKDLEAVAATMP